MRKDPRWMWASFVLVGAALMSCGSESGGADAAGSSTPGVAGEVTVFAAASLKAAFTDLGRAFTAAHPDANVTFSFAASSDLVTQINEGAPADVYASADRANMQKLVDAGGNATDPVVFATNRLEIVVGEGNPEGITGLVDLADPDLIVVTCAPEVPCGRYAAEVFGKAGVEVTPKSLEENVNAVVSKVRIGEADAGIAYRTDVIAASGEVDGVEIPPELNVLAEYPIVVTAEAPNPIAAQAFVDLTLSEEGRAVFATHGFTTP